MMTRNLVHLFILMAAMFAGSSMLYGQDSQLTLENIYSKRAFGQRGFGPLRWLKDSKGYSTVENNKELGGREIIRYDAQSGE